MELQKPHEQAFQGGSGEGGGGRSIKRSQEAEVEEDSMDPARR